MKLIFSVTLYLLALNCFASRIQILYQDGAKEHAKAVEAIFTNKYKIPETLITLKISKGCNGVDNRFLELCIRKDSTLLVIPNKNMELIKSSFTVFYKGFKNAI